MPDFTMCDGHVCPMRENCKRHKSIPSERQTYFMKIPFNGESCQHFIPLNEENSPQFVQLELPNIEKTNGKHSTDSKTSKKRHQVAISLDSSATESIAKVT